MTDVNRGLNLSDPGSTTPDEARAFKEFYAKEMGNVHRGLGFWLDHRPEVLKRYRQFADSQTPGALEVDRSFTGFSFLPYYALLGYDVGVRYLVHLQQKSFGLTKSQILEGLAIAFLHGGPRGMETIAIALDDYEWIEPASPVRFPEGWAPDPDAFRSGLDFSSPEMTPQEGERLEHWFRETLGEVPRYVPFMLKYRPNVLKAYRSRYENILQEMPKQTMPYTLLHFHVTQGSAEGVRENVLLARAFGMTKSQTLQPIFSAMNNGGPEAMSMVDAAAGDVFESWN